jgi:ABC-2 type transport system permease protein
MPNWLEPVAEYNPFTTMVDAARALFFVGTEAGNDIWGAVVRSLVIIAVFSVLSVWRYRRAVGR